MSVMQKRFVYGVFLSVGLMASSVIGQDVSKVLEGMMKPVKPAPEADPQVEETTLQAEEVVAVPDVIEAPSPESVVESEVAVESEVVVDAKVVDVPVSTEAEVVEVLDPVVETGDGAEALMDSVDVDGVTTDDSGNLISVRLVDVGLEEAITLFAQLSGANIIIPELAEAQTISVTMTDVEWQPALQSILETYDYELYESVAGSGVFNVRRRPEGAPERQEVKTYLLNYATVPDAAELIRSLLPPDAKVSEFPSRNAIVVKSSQASLSEIEAVLKEVDRVREQVYIESKFMELSSDVQKDLGIDWSVLEGYGVGASVNSRITDTRQFDVNGNKLEEAEAPQYVQDAASGNSERFQLVTPTTEAVSTAVLNADEFNLVLSALKQERDINIVSNPKIIVANEEAASISIVRREPNLKQNRQQALNNQPDTVTYELDQDRPFFDYGIKLEVIPSINTASNVTVNINPSLTRKYADKQAGDISYPIIDEKSIQTEFNLASGQTAAIGGLTEVEEGDVEKKVPFLGSIPLIGRLFKWNQKLNGQKETIIFVTVGLANTENIKEADGLPEDTELARRRVIRDRNNKILREHGRAYFEVQDGERIDDTLKKMDAEERRRLEKRQAILERKG